MRFSGGAESSVQESRMFIQLRTENDLFRRLNEAIDARRLADGWSRTRMAAAGWGQRDLCDIGSTGPEWEKKGRRRTMGVEKERKKETDGRHTHQKSRCTTA